MSMLPAVTGLVTILLSWAARCAMELVTFGYVIHSSASGGQIERTWKVGRSFLLTSRISNGFFNNLVHVLSKQCGVSVSVHLYLLFCSDRFSLWRPGLACCLLYVQNDLKFKKLSPLILPSSKITNMRHHTWLQYESVVNFT